MDMDTTSDMRSVTASVNGTVLSAVVNTEQHYSTLSATFLANLQLQPDLHTVFSLHVLTVSGFFASTMPLLVAVSQTQDLVLGKDWIDSVHPQFYNADILDPMPMVYLSERHSWSSWFVGMFAFLSACNLFSLAIQMPPRTKLCCHIISVQAVRHYLLVAGIIYCHQTV